MSELDAGPTPDAGPAASPAATEPETTETETTQTTESNDTNGSMEPGTTMDADDIEHAPAAETDTDEAPWTDASGNGTDATAEAAPEPETDVPAEPVGPRTVGRLIAD